MATKKVKDSLELLRSKGFHVRTIVAEKIDRVLPSGLTLVQDIDRNKEPHPYRLFEDAGGAYLMGLVGGGIKSFGTGMLAAPIGKKIRGGWELACLTAPQTATSFAVWSGAYSVCDHFVVRIRGKEDMWNSLFSGVLSNSLLNFQDVGSTGAALKAGLSGSVMVVAIELLSIGSSRVSTKNRRNVRNSTSRS